MEPIKSDKHFERLAIIQKELAERIIPDCIDTYLNYTLASLQGLLTTFNSSIFMHFRSTIENNITIIYRIKSNKSVINNISKEILKQSIKMIRENPDAFIYDDDKPDIENQRKKEELITLTKRVTENVYKDYFGATLIFNTKNDMDRFCQSLIQKQRENGTPKNKKEELEAEVVALYKQANTVSRYLTSSKESTGKKSFFHSLLKSDFIDISDTFVDKDPDPRAPRSVKPLDIANMNTLEDYYTEQINLLTLLTNISIPCNEPESNGNIPKYCICELDKPVLEVFEEALEKAENPDIKDDVIKKFNELTEQYYFNHEQKEAYKKQPFDVQLDKAFEEMQRAKTGSNYKKKLSSQDKKIYTKKLLLLQDNLKKLNKTRLLASILKLKLPELIYKNNEYPSLNLKVTFEKERAEANGFYTLSYIIDLNGVNFELHAQPEFCYKYSINGNCAHNSVLKGKSFNLISLFELKSDSHTLQEKNPELLKMYCTFLAGIDQISYMKDIEDSSLQRKFQEHIHYAISKIQLKDELYYTDSGETVSFADYISSLIEYNGAQFGTISPAHRIMPNQAIATPQNELSSLEDILKSRVGLSVLANLVRTKYKREMTDKGKFIGAHLKTREYALDLIAEDFAFDIHATNRDVKPLSRERKTFYPQGQTPDSER